MNECYFTQLSRVWLQHFLYTILSLKDEGTAHDVGNDETQGQPDGNVPLGIVLSQVLKDIMQDMLRKTGNPLSSSRIDFLGTRLVHKHAF